MSQQSHILSKPWAQSPRKRPSTSRDAGQWRGSIGSGRAVRAIIMLLALAGFGAAGLGSEEPPRRLTRDLAASGSRFEKERGHYTYRQRFVFRELSPKGGQSGFYREVRDIVFSPSGERLEQLVGPPVQQLSRIRLTEEDFRDIREVQPFVLTQDTLWNYEFVYKGTELLDGEDCFVYRMRPRQVLEGQRLLDGMIWVSREHHQVVKVAGQPVPQIYRDKEENLFPQFTTIYQPVDGEFWFPVRTIANDILPFRTGPQHVQYVIEYQNYKRFRAESIITFEEAGP